MVEDIYRLCDAERELHCAYLPGPASGHYGTNLCVLDYHGEMRVVMDECLGQLCRDGTPVRLSSVPCDSPHRMPHSNKIDNAPVSRSSGLESGFETSMPLRGKNEPSSDPEMPRKMDREG